MAPPPVGPELEIWGAILLGLVIGFIELVFVHQDERGLGWLGHGLHAVPFTILFTFITMNVGFVLSKIPKLGIASNPVTEAIVIVVIGIIAMAKIAAAAAIAGNTRIGEKKIHILVIGLLIIAAPYAWKYGLKAVLMPFLNSLPFT